jgi:hypothetical protein
VPDPARSRSHEVLLAAAASVLALVLVWSVVHWWPSPTLGGTPRAQESVRLGPLPGQSVSGYLAGLTGHLPPAGAGPVPALIQFTDERPVADVASLLAAAAVTPVRVVFRVPLPRVQTALRFEQLTQVDLRDPARSGQRRLTLARDAVARRAVAEASRAAGRQAAVARYEAAALGGGDCRCVLAVLALGDRAALTKLSSRPGVRAVDAAPVGAASAELALAPLLPEQSGKVGPLADDGPVPAVPVNPGGSG